jgi:hypothetical protein
MNFHPTVLNEQAVTKPQSPELTNRILVVEDDPSVQRTMQGRLAQRF